MIDVKHGDKVINKVYRGREMIWERINLIDCVFPNKNAKMTSSNSYGINVYVNSRNKPDQDGWYTLDGTTETAWMLYNSAQDYGRLIIVLPFPVKLQSLTIVNKSTYYSQTAATVNGLQTGEIYVSDGEVTDTSKMTTLMTLYDSIDRQQPMSSEDLKGYSKTHKNPDFADTWIKSIGIRGKSWGPKGTSSWKAIGEIKLNFKAKESDIIAAGLQ